MEIIEKYPTKPWDWEEISCNPNLTMEIIEKYPDKNWNWKGISVNPNITMEIINKYPDKPWDWDAISSNENITIEMINKYPNKGWYWQGLSENPFEKDYENELKKLKLEIIEEELIQKTWHPSRFQEWCWDEDQKKIIKNNNIFI